MKSNWIFFQVYLLLHIDIDYTVQLIKDNQTDHNPQKFLAILDWDRTLLNSRTKLLLSRNKHLYQLPIASSSSKTSTIWSSAPPSSSLFHACMLFFFLVFMQAFIILLNKSVTTIRYHLNYIINNFLITSFCFIFKRVMLEIQTFLQFFFFFTNC